MQKIKRLEATVHGNFREADIHVKSKDAQEELNRQAYNKKEQTTKYNPFQTAQCRPTILLERMDSEKPLSRQVSV